MTKDNPQLEARRKDKEFRLKGPAPSSAEASYELGVLQRLATTLSQAWRVEKPYRLLNKRVITHDIESSTTENPISLRQCTLSKFRDCK